MRLSLISVNIKRRYSITLVIEGLQSLFKQQASRESAAYRSRVMGGGDGGGSGNGAEKRKRGGGRDLSGVTRMAVESALVTSQLNSALGIRLSSGHKETAQLVHTYTRAVAAKVDRGKQTVFMKVVLTPTAQMHA